MALALISFLFQEIRKGFSNFSFLTVFNFSKYLLINLSLLKILSGFWLFFLFFVFVLLEERRSLSFGKLKCIFFFFLFLENREDLAFFKTRKSFSLFCFKGERLLQDFWNQKGHFFLELFKLAIGKPQGFYGEKFCLFVFFF